MRDAIAALVAWQLGVAGGALPPYDDALLRRELALFPDWCVDARMRRRLDAAEQATWRRPATSSSPPRSPSRPSPCTATGCRAT